MHSEDRRKHLKHPLPLSWQAEEFKSCFSAPPKQCLPLLPTAGSQHQTPTFARVGKQRAHSRPSREPRKPWSRPEARDLETPLPERNSNCPPGSGVAQAHIGALGALAETARVSASSGTTAGRGAAAGLGRGLVGLAAKGYLNRCSSYAAPSRVISGSRPS